VEIACDKGGKYQDDTGSGVLNEKELGEDNKNAE
jgi:hypothetical protein